MRNAVASEHAIRVQRNAHLKRVLADARLDEPVLRDRLKELELVRWRFGDRRLFVFLRRGEAQVADDLRSLADEAIRGWGGSGWGDILWFRMELP